MPSHDRYEVIEMFNTMSSVPNPFAVNLCMENLFLRKNIDKTERFHCPCFITPLTLDLNLRY